MDSRHSRASSHTLVGESCAMHDRGVSDDGATCTAMVSQNSKTGHIPYDYGSRTSAYLGLLGTLIVGISLVVFSVFLYLGKVQPTPIHPQFDYKGAIGFEMSPTASTVLDLVLNILVTLCTESTGFVHSTTLKWRLAQEGRLKFNANLRLIRGSGCWLAANGTILNIIHAVLLILSYVSASFISTPLNTYNTQSGQPTIPITVIQLSAFPTAVLGVGLFSQALISSMGIIGTKIPTWSTSIFDVSAAALSNNYIHYTNGRCMRSLNDESSEVDPVRPSRLQPSPFNSATDVRRIVWFLWALPPLALLWGAIVWIIIRLWPTLQYDCGYVKLTAGLVPGLNSDGSYAPPNLAVGLGEGSTATWLYSITIIAVFQSFLTMALHCCELIVTMIRDEKQWRSARWREGVRLKSNPLFIFLSSWRSVTLFVTKPILHWLFGNSISRQKYESQIVMYPIQILYLCLAVLLFAIFITLTARAPIHGRQPVAYGHIQTMVNLIDDWSRSPDGQRMFWGHKSLHSDGICHAGTSGRASDVSEVFLDAYYAGSGVEPRKRVAHADSIVQELPK